MQSLELLFDAATEVALRAEWATLDDAGLPSSARNTSPSNRPHVTVAVARNHLDRSLDVVRSSISELLPLPVSLGSYLVFPATHGAVLSRALVVSRALLELHARVLGVVSADAQVLDTARIDSWTPHATIARRLTPEQLGSAIALLPRARLSATAEGLRLWDSETRTVTLVVGRDQA